MIYKNYIRFFQDRFKIVNKNAKEIPFQANEIQTKFMSRDAGGRDIVLKARQQGFSTCVTGIFTTDFLLKENILSMVIADDSDNAKGLLEKVKMMISSYEDITQTEVPLKYNSKYELHNKANNCKYIIGTAQSGAVGRSKTIHNLHLSEFAFYPNAEDILSGALQAVPENGRVIIETTANGFNYFKDFWDRSVAGETGFQPHFYPASKFYDKDFLIKKKQELDRLFPQEYPETPIEAFITSGDLYFDRYALQFYLEQTKHVQTI